MNPTKENFHFPAEWATHKATWLSFPWNIDTWEDRFDKILPPYFSFIKTLTESEEVCINVANQQVRTLAEEGILKYNIDRKKVILYNFQTNDSWCRDHGPSFVVNPETKEKAIVNWGYNAWGGKYPPFDDDDAIPKRVAKILKLKLYEPGIIMEGGSIEVNGSGSLLTSKSCLLNKNRNPLLNQMEIEQFLIDYYGVKQILWVEDGIVGDDTDGHIDDTTRFINPNTVIAAMEENRLDDNHTILKENLGMLKKMRLLNNESLNIVELPMPDPVYDSGLRLPASYANFYISNKHVIVPIYKCKKDDLALEIIQKAFKEREVVGIDSTDIIWGLGSFHCLSQQEPSI
jgi:agmatine deiminase